MTMMMTVHAALRRDLERLARASAKAADDPARLHGAHAGWLLFSRFLTVHHVAEDEYLWPQVRELVVADDRELLDAMEAEHARVDPLIDAIDATLGDPNRERHELAELVDALSVELRQHLAHEEREALPLIGRVLSEEGWAKFGEANQARIGTRASVFLPWLLDEAEPANLENTLRYIPPHLAELYHETWRVQYVESDPWGGKAAIEAR